MEGITVLATVERMTRVFTWTAGAIVALMVCIFLCVVIVVCTWEMDESKLLLAILPLAMFGALTVTLAGYTLVEDIPYYKIMIDEEVPYSDLVEHYEVIEQEGLILTVKERTSEEKASSN